MSYAQRSTAWGVDLAQRRYRFDTTLFQLHAAGYVLARVVLLVAAALWAGPAAAQFGTDPGAELAEEHCGECHSADATLFPGEAGPLAEAAQARRWTGRDLKGWLATSHPPIPDLPLTSQQIHSLERHLDALADEGALPVPSFE
jgi:mono/diheme cytochrome c family protein